MNIILITQMYVFSIKWGLSVRSKVHVLIRMGQGLPRVYAVFHTFHEEAVLTCILLNGHPLPKFISPSSLLGNSLAAIFRPPPYLLKESFPRSSENP